MRNLKFIYFVCSPGLGILDNWLPIIFKLRAKYPNSKLVCIITKPGTAEVIDLNNVLIKIADDLFDLIVYKSNAGQWFECISFGVAKAQNTPSSLKRIIFLFKKYFLRYQLLSPLLRVVRLIYGLLDFFSPKKKIKLNKFETQDSVVLYDVYEETKEYNRELLEYFIGVPKFSISHGTHIEQKGTEHCRITNLSRAPNEVNVFLFSKDEKEYYKRTYLLKDPNIFIVGVPRHNQEWVSYLNSVSYGEEQKWDDYIFFISRTVSEYLPLDRKIKAIQDIRKLAFEDFGLKIIVKLHPKEHSSGIYEKILGKDNYGVKWKYSSVHPFFLGKHCAFAIALYSGVSVDMAALNVPTIEYLNLNGLKEFDNKDSLKDENGISVLEFRYMKIVLGSSNYEQLKSQANYIMSNRSVIINKFYKRYCELYSKPDKSISSIVNQIIKDRNC
jgi:hypothetical protein